MPVHTYKHTLLGRSSQPSLLVCLTFSIVPRTIFCSLGRRKKKKKRRKGKCSIPEALGSTTSAAGAPPAACPAHAPFKSTRLIVNWIEAKERSGSLLSFLGLFCNGKARNRNKLASFIAHLIPWSLQLETDCPWKQASRRASYPRGIFQSHALLGRVAFVRFFCGCFPESRPCCVNPSSCLSSPNGRDYRHVITSLAYAVFVATEAHS